MPRKIIYKKELRNKKDKGYVYIEQNKNNTYTVYLYVFGVGRVRLGKDKRKKHYTLNEAKRIYNARNRL